ncbi:MAG: UDP-2,4-diacetamido-2,4,6-trideoxy-beta-L-altropyranose hydrolase [Rhodospirillales bacterium]|nr:UDP-2,4-diacetamido-2,4,6-trideoxy-beta-L-altropyranose hydrolase [Rhodospirillales bacterium]
MPIAVFRARASVAIGGGHVSRCLALADELRSLGWTCGFAVNAETRGVFPHLERSGHDILDLAGDGADDPNALRDRWSGHVDWLVVDDYAIDRAYEAACRPWARRILVVDDLANRKHECEVLIDHNPGRAPEHYAGLTPVGCELLLGPAYALLRSQFAATRDSRRPPNGRAGRPILVSIGATDPGNITLRVLNALESAGYRRPVEVVLGHAFPHRRQVADAATSLGFPVTLHHDVEDMCRLLSRCGLAIGAAGISALERCCLGVPTLMVVSADNQRLAARELERAGAVSMIGDVGGLGDEALADRIRRFIDDGERLTEMARAAERICDGRGARRAAMAVVPAFAKDGGRVTLRPATMADADTILAWQQDSETRRFARNPEAPAKGEHRAWMENKLNDPACVMNIVLHTGSPSGALRMDGLQKIAKGPYDYEISIYVAPGKYRLGIGTAALELGRRLLPRATFVAHVLADNEASHVMFRKAGYVRQDGRYVNRPKTPAAAVGTVNGRMPIANA